MDNPCNTCLVKVSCSEACVEYAEWFLNEKMYRTELLSIRRYIESLTRNKAIEYILEVESTIRYINKNEETFQKAINNFKTES